MLKEESNLLNNISYTFYPVHIVVVILLLRKMVLPCRAPPSATTSKVKKIKENSLDLIPSPSVKIQIMGGKVCLRCKGKYWRAYSHQNFENIKFVDINQQCFALLPQVNFPAKIWIFTEGDGIKSRLSSFTKSLLLYFPWLLASAISSENCNAKTVPLLEKEVFVLIVS